MEFWVIHAQENPAAPRSEAGRREWRSNSICEELSDRGHQVTRWRSSFSHQAKVQLVQGSVREPIDTYHHQFIASPDYRRHVGLARVRNHRVLGRNFSKLAAGYSRAPDLIHVGNVPIELCYAAVRYGTQRGIPVVVDVRDLWPDIYLDVLPRKLGFLRPLGQKILDLTSDQLRYAFGNATSITALTQSYLEWGLEKAQRERHPRDAIFPMCYPVMEITPQDADVADIRHKLGLSKTDVLACYFGNIGSQSDFDGVVAAAQQLQTVAPQVKFIIAGSGPREADIRSQAKGVSNVIVPGWLQGREVQALMSIASFGLIIYNPVPNFLRNIPNKFSEYLAGGLAVACGLEGEMGSAVRESGCGFVYSSGDPQALVNGLQEALADHVKLKQMQQTAKELHASRFDGSQLYDRFADYLLSIAEEEKACK